MATSANNRNRLFDGMSGSFNGVNSGLHPQDIDPQAWSWGINVQNDGGDFVTRPGFASKFRLPDGKAQGCVIFTPTSGSPQIVCAVNGKIYVSGPPYDTFMVLPNIQFHPTVDHIAFKACIQAIDNGTLIDPKAILVMQDSRTRPAYWDGSTSRHLNPGGSTNETVIGMWMEWVGSRLWVAKENQIFASDIYDPLHFNENTYLASGGALQTSDGLPVTALAKTSDDKALLAGTIDNTTIIRAGITDRSLWKITEDFITILFTGVGFSSGKGFAYLNGELWWMSKDGGRRFTQVASSIQVSRNTVATHELNRSFINLSPILSRACAMSFESNVGFSVPSGDIYNRHTWVLETSIANLLTSSTPPAWDGLWMGTRPVEWASATINGVNRCFFLSQDRDGGVRVWEAFQEDRTDDGHRIFCSLESRGMDFQEKLAFKKYLFTELHLTQVLGQVDLTVDYKGDYGCWKRILDIVICATKCRQLACDNLNTALTPQNRFYKTQEAQGAQCETQEGPFSEEIGTYFQNRIRWYGENGINKFKAQANQWQEASTGECSAGDLDSNGLLVCKPLLCCDEEVDYISIPNDRPYSYGSSNSTQSSV